MSVMVIGVTDNAHMISLQLWVLPRSSKMLGILYRRLDSIIVYRVVLLVSYLWLVVTLIPTSL